MQAPGGVHQDHVHIAGFGRDNRVVHHGSGVGVLFLADQLRSRALCPDSELLGRGGTERVACGKNHFLALFFDQPVGQLPEARGLADPVHPDHQIESRATLRHLELGIPWIAQRLGERDLKPVLNFACRGHALVAHHAPEAL